MTRCSGPTTRSVRRTLTGIGLTAVLALSACGGGDDDDASYDADFGAPAPEAPADDATGDFAAEEPGVASGVGGDGSGIDLGIVGRDVIIEMDVEMSSDDIARTVAAITADASRLGGGVASSEIDYGDPASEHSNQGYAILTVKVPPDRVEDLLSGLDDTGEVRSVSQSAQDVTEQLIDLDVRIENARESVANVRDFMERAEDLADLVTLEGELTRRQTELERLEAQERNLSDRVALSTITIQVVPTASAPPPIDDDDDTIGDAFEEGWDAFVSFVFAIGYTLAVLAPFIVLGGVVLAALWWMRRRYRRNTPDDDTPAPSAEPLPEPIAPTTDEDTPGV